MYLYSNIHTYTLLLLVLIVCRLPLIHEHPATDYSTCATVLCTQVTFNGVHLANYFGEQWHCRNYKVLSKVTRLNSNIMTILTYLHFCLKVNYLVCHDKQTFGKGKIARGRKIQQSPRPESRQEGCRKCTVNILLLHFLPFQRECPVFCSIPIPLVSVQSLIKEQNQNTNISATRWGWLSENLLCSQFVSVTVTQSQQEVLRTFNPDLYHNKQQ